MTVTRVWLSSLIRQVHSHWNWGWHLSPISHAHLPVMDAEFSTPQCPIPAHAEALLLGFILGKYLLWCLSASHVLRFQRWQLICPTHKAQFNSWIYKRHSDTWSVKGDIFSFRLQLLSCPPSQSDKESFDYGGGGRRLSKRGSIVSCFWSSSHLSSLRQWGMGSPCPAHQQQGWGALNCNFLLSIQGKLCSGNSQLCFHYLTY